MGQVDLATAQSDCALRSSVRQRAAEEGELVAKAPPVRGLQVAGVIPPLGLEIGVRAEILGEGELAGPSARAKSPRFSAAPPGWPARCPA